MRTPHLLCQNPRTLGLATFLSMSVLCLSPVPSTALAQAGEEGESSDENGAPGEESEGSESGGGPASSAQLDEAARLTFQEGQQAFLSGDYETALTRFRQAYELSQRPLLLYNIAQSLDRLRRDEETVTALERYLEAVPDAENRGEVEARIRVLRAAIERNAPPPDENEEEEVTNPPAENVEPTEESNPLAIFHPAIFIAVAALAVGGGVAIGVTGAETLSRNDAYTATTDVNEAEQLLDDANSMQLITNVMIGVTAGLAAAAVVFAILTDWDELTGGNDAESASAPSVRPFAVADQSGALAGVGGRF